MDKQTFWADVMLFLQILYNVDKNKADICRFWQAQNLSITLP